MYRSKIAKIDAGVIERMVNRSVDARRWMGAKQECAMEDTATALGVRPRRIRSFIRGEITQAPIREYRRMLHRWWADMDKQAAALQELGIAVQKDAEAVWLAENQLSLPLENTCSVRSQHKSASGVGGKTSQ